MNNCKICDGDLEDIGSIQCGAMHQEYQEKEAKKRPDNDFTRENEALRDYSKTVGYPPLQAFYRLKSLLLPSFLRRNKQSLNSLEAELIREYEKGEAYKCYEEHTRGKYAGCSIPHYHEKGGVEK